MTNMLIAQKNRKHRNWPPVMPSGQCRRAASVDAEKDRHADSVDRLAADPRLDAEPAARDQRAQQGRHVRAARAERRAAIKPETEFRRRARVRVEDHRDEHDDVAEKNRQDGLPPIHAAADQTDASM